MARDAAFNTDRAVGGAVEAGLRSKISTNNRAPATRMSPLSFTE